MGKQWASPNGARTGFYRALLAKVYLPLPWANYGLAPMGPVRDLTGLAHARTNPAVPMVARTNTVRDLTGLTNWESVSGFIFLIELFFPSNWYLFERPR